MRAQMVPSLSLSLAAAMLLTACEHPPMESTQLGYRGTGMVEVDNPRLEAANAAGQVVPDALPPVPADGPRARDLYSNVPVLGDLSAAEFNRVMAAITVWVSPEQGCTYCHAPGEDLAADTLYTKVVSRRMLQMTRDINSQWDAHVGATGVTCYTCHRGKNVPEEIWYQGSDPRQAAGLVGYRAGQNAPAEVVGLTSLPFDPFSTFLDDAAEIRVVSAQALPVGPGPSIKDAEHTYALMMHMSDALGVNCTYCHNTRSFAEWDASRAPRVTAWHGIRLTRSLNEAYLEPLQDVFPANRLGPLGDVPKVSCGTCHRGASKPLLGVSMYLDYPELGAPRPAPAMETPAEGAPADGAPAEGTSAEGAAVEETAAVSATGEPAQTS